MLISTFLEVSVIVGRTTTLTATVTPADAISKDITWSSLHPDIATVDASTGEVTGVEVGTATIRAAAADGSGVSNTKTVTATTAVYTVTFNSNGGSAVTSQTVIDGDDATEPAAPTKTGYTFAGWLEDAALLIPATFPHTITGNVTFYAKWEAEVVPTYYIDDVMDDGSNKYLRLSGSNSSHGTYARDFPTPLSEIVIMVCNLTAKTHQVYIDGILMSSTTGGIPRDEFPMGPQMPTNIHIISGLTFLTQNKSA